MIAFDIPNLQNSKDVFESRFKKIFPHIPADHPFVVSLGLFYCICVRDLLQR